MKNKYKDDDNETLAEDDESDAILGNIESDED